MKHLHWKDIERAFENTAKVFVYKGKLISYDEIQVMLFLLSIAGSLKVKGNEHCYRIDLQSQPN